MEMEQHELEVLGLNSAISPIANRARRQLESRNNEDVPSSSIPYDVEQIHADIEKCSRLVWDVKGVRLSYISQRICTRVTKANYDTHQRCIYSAGGHYRFLQFRHRYAAIGGEPWRLRQSRTVRSGC